MQREDSTESTRVAWYVAGLTLVILLLSSQHSYWGDGYRMFMNVDFGMWRYHHALFLPAAQLFRFLLQPFPGIDTESAMLIYLAICGAAGAGLLTRAASLLGASPLAAAFGGLLTIATPSVFFFATSIEIHSPHFFSACLAIYGFAKWRCSGKAPDALTLSFYFLCMMGFHISSATWAPAFFFLSIFGTGKPRLPTRIIPALILLAAAFFGWSAINPGGSPAPSLLSSSLAAIFRDFKFDYIVREYFANGAFLFLLPFVLIFKSKVTWQTSALIFLLVVAPAIIFQTLYIEEQGAYFIPAYCVLGLLSALGLARLKRAVVPIALVLLSAQGYLAHKLVWEWQYDFRGAEWAIPLVEECDDRGLFLSLENWESHAIQRHSHIVSVSLRTLYRKKVVETSLDSEEARMAMINFIDQNLPKGGSLSITRSLIEYGEEKQSVAKTLELIAAKYGQIQMDPNKAYFVFPKASASQ